MAAEENFRDYASKLAPAPLNAQHGDRFVRSVALLDDGIAESARIAVQGRYPSSPDYLVNATHYRGRDRSLERFPAEPESSHRQRVQNAWEIWSRAGTGGIIIQMLGYLGLTAEIYENHDWNWDGDSANWSRFWVVITGHPWSAGFVWGDGSVWGGGWVWGITASLEEVRTVRGIVNKFRPAHVICPYIIVVIDSMTWSPTPDGTWDAPANRNAGAVYISGANQ